MKQEEHNGKMYAENINNLKQKINKNQPMSLTGTCIYFVNMR